MTKQKPFFVNGSKKAEVPMMHQTARFDVAAVDGAIETPSSLQAATLHSLMTGLHQHITLSCADGVYRLAHSEPECLHGVTSIGGSMAITVACCHDMLPDPEFYVRCLKDSFEELCDASKVARV